MDITQLQTAKKSLEDEIQKAASAALERFRAETGLSPYNVSIQLIDSPTLAPQALSTLLAKLKPT